MHPSASISATHSCWSLLLSNVQLQIENSSRQTTKTSWLTSEFVISTWISLFLLDYEGCILFHTEILSLYKLWECSPSAYGLPLQSSVLVDWVRLFVGRKETYAFRSNVSYFLLKLSSLSQGSICISIRQ